MKNLAKLGMVLMLLFAALKWPKSAKAASQGGSYQCSNGFYSQQNNCEQQMYQCTQYCPRTGHPSFVFCFTTYEPDSNTGAPVEVTTCYNGPNDYSCSQQCVNNINSCIQNALQEYCTYVQ